MAGRPRPGALPPSPARSPRPTRHWSRVCARPAPSPSPARICRTSRSAGTPTSGVAGRTRNPWDPTRTPGGSSGGEAVALATGMTPLGFGNDLGGSLRVPSQMCGTTALRPSRGRVADAAVTEPSPPLAFQMTNCQGPMARRVADLRLALSIISAPDARDPRWVPAPLQGPAVRHAGPGRRRSQPARRRDRSARAVRGLTAPPAGWPTPVTKSSTPSRRRLPRPRPRGSTRSGRKSVCCGRI